MRRLLIGLAAALLGIALLAVLMPGAARSAAPKPTSHDAVLTAEAHAAFVKYMSSHQPLVRNGSPVLKASAGTGTLPSVNWSGYADEESGTQTVTSVSAHWIIPRVSCLPYPYHLQDAFISQWVGIDGATDGTVEQLGSATQCFEGQTFYYVWYEMFPGGTVQEGTAACINDNVDCPRPGDQISASVTVTPGTSGENNYTLSLTDFTTAGNNFSISQPCATNTCLDSSAEWIIERPAFALPFGFQILPLVDFDFTGFTNGTVGSGGSVTNISGFHGGPVDDVTMSDDSGSYYLDCVGQFGPPGQLLQTTSTPTCPTVAPIRGSDFFATWDSSF